jgi:hypothetical protein
MANPNRPNDDEIIPAQWGQLVADRVVRRYRSRDERDVDMAGILDRAGQLVVIHPTGQAPWLEFHDGYEWRRVAAGPLIGGDTDGIYEEVVRNGWSLSQTPKWLVGGMRAGMGFGTTRALIVPIPGLYRVVGSVGHFWRGGNPGLDYSSILVYRVHPIEGEDFNYNDAGRRLLEINGSNPDRTWVYKTSVFAGVVACNEGDGLMPVLNCNPTDHYSIPVNAVGGTTNGFSFCAYFIGDLPPGLVPPTPPRTSEDPGTLPAPEAETLPT